ncbi:fibrinogen gamma chain [Pseudoliparis swirei]|uniref:fibrinogen gamma chain n=1 Tax=Pseudoliparis swirei TaxID=2059687 RepID=UPI0024BE5EBF|nr:fibrinogen gamma chain [Pseudoliparis swirei]
MAPSLLATAGGLLLLLSLSSAQTRGDNIAACTIHDSFGTYCPTTCGVTDYMHRYMSEVDEDLESMQKKLATIANLTQGADQTIVYMKDSTLMAQKNTLPDPYHKRSTSILEDIVRFEKTSIAQEQQIYELQNIISSNEKRMSNLKQLSIQLQHRCTDSCKESVDIQPLTGTDCQDIANKGGIISGLYYVKPAKATEQFLVYCEIDEFRRGFTVIQRRRDGSEDFHKDWMQYKNGFGHLSPGDTTEFWLGNEKIHLLTATTTMPTVLRIELVDWQGAKKYADYTMFRVGSESDMYRLTYGYFLGGDAGDAFDGFDFGDDPSDKFYTSHNGMQFSTVDKDNDKYQGSCAQQDGSGWWMNRCHAAHLNGKYYQGGTYTEKDAGEFGFDNGIIWVTWHNRWYSLKETTMKLIPLSRITAGGGQQTGVKQFGGL